MISSGLPIINGVRVLLCPFVCSDNTQSSEYNGLRRYEFRATCTHDSHFYPCDSAPSEGWSVRTRLGYLYQRRGA
ncbi:hypothetical protein RSAG8_11126, partial [Rhizoctonia solani AG-8 WAC10335]